MCVLLVGFVLGGIVGGVRVVVVYGIIRSGCMCVVLVVKCGVMGRVNGFVLGF